MSAEGTQGDCLHQSTHGLGSTIIQSEKEPLYEDNGLWLESDSKDHGQGWGG